MQYLTCQCQPSTSSPSHTAAWGSLIPAWPTHCHSYCSFLKQKNWSQPWPCLKPLSDFFFHQVKDQALAKLSDLAHLSSLGLLQTWYLSPQNILCHSTLPRWLSINSYIWPTSPYTSIETRPKFLAKEVSQCLQLSSPMPETNVSHVAATVYTSVLQRKPEGWKHSSFCCTLRA